VRLQDDIGEAVHTFAELAGEAKPERLVDVAPEPDPAVLARTLLRLRHDLVMIGRAASAPLPDRLGAHLGPALAQVGATARDYLLASATALSLRKSGPSPEPVERAVTEYVSEVASIRAEALMNGLAVGEPERIFALGFALQQLQQNFSDLAVCLGERARRPDETRVSRWQRDSKRLAVRIASLRKRRVFPKFQHGLAYKLSTSTLNQGASNARA
jgi:hypothetical protein